MKSSGFICEFVGMLCNVYHLSMLDQSTFAVFAFAMHVWVNSSESKFGEMKSQSLGMLNVCTKFYRNPSHSFQYISVWIKLGWIMRAALRYWNSEWWLEVWMFQDAVSFFNCTLTVVLSLTTCAVCFSGGANPGFLWFTSSLFLSKTGMSHFLHWGKFFPVNVIQAETYFLGKYICK